MKAAVIGAGVAGLAAARLLNQSQVQVTVFEKSRGLGGRSATKRIGPYTFDSGATSVTPRGLFLEQAMLHDLSTEGLVKIDKPIFRHDQGRISPGDRQKNTSVRYAYAAGMNQLGKRLGEGLDIRFETKIENLEAPGDGGWSVGGECFDWVILTAPAPQSLDILKASGLNRPIAPAVYRMTLSVLLGFDHPLEAPWHALINPDQDEPLTWLSAESLKCPGTRAPEGHTALVAQMSRSYSRTRFEAPEDQVISETLIDITRLIGPSFAKPVVTGLHRWRFAQPEATVSFEAANPVGASLLVAGDALEGPRIESAYESGIKAARRILESL